MKQLEQPETGGALFQQTSVASPNGIVSARHETILWILWEKSQSTRVMFLSSEKKTLFSLNTQASAGPFESTTDWLTNRLFLQRGERLDQHVNCMTFLPWLPQISPITSGRQASLASGRPAGTTSPTQELLSASAQMALRQQGSDTSTDEEMEGGQGRQIFKGGRSGWGGSWGKNRREERESTIGRNRFRFIQRWKIQTIHVDCWKHCWILMWQINCCRFALTFCCSSFCKNLFLLFKEDLKHKHCENSFQISHIV